MAREPSIIEMGSWLKSPPGRYLLDWELHRLDHAVADLFGFHALQLGLPEIDALRANRMPHRWVANDRPQVPERLAVQPPHDDDITTLPPQVPVALACEFEALPFPADSLDLVVMPHALEFAHDAHQVLREVVRVLRPEGHVVLTGFNPASLWGVRQGLASTRLGLAPMHDEAAVREGVFIGYWRLRDWLRLLGLHIEAGRFGCWRPPLGTATWLERMRWMDRVGERWWPVLGGAYVLQAVKRVHGMRLVGLAPGRRKAPARAAVAASRSTSRSACAARDRREGIR